MMGFPARERHTVSMPRCFLGLCPIFCRVDYTVAQVPPISHETKEEDNLWERQADSGQETCGEGDFSQRCTDWLFLVS